MVTRRKAEGYEEEDTADLVALHSLTNPGKRRMCLECVKRKAWVSHTCSNSTIMMRGSQKELEKAG